tara:strand:+ start:196 stop:498 length:303 start_codon:yes stop_codon:yes gene_type:complete
MSVFLVNIIVVNVFNISITIKEVVFFHVFLSLLFLLTKEISRKIKKPTLSLALNFFRIIVSALFIFLFVKTEKTQIFLFFFIYFLYLFSSVLTKEKSIEK